jgi:serine/threonine protein kinase
MSKLLPSMTSDRHATDLAEGGVFSGYRLESLVSQGPFSEVWKASFGDGTPVAIKFARGELGLRMLRDEVDINRRLSALGHAVLEVPGYFDSDHSEFTGERPYLVLPWLEGGTLRARLGPGLHPDQRAQVAEYVLSLCRAMGHIHRAGVIHGDLKPENVLFDSLNRVRVIDFGLAKQLRTARLGQSLRQSLSTDDDLVGGTLAYMPPEAVKGGDSTPRGDVYALGVMLHEVLMGRRPDKATSPEELRAILPHEVVDILLRALAFEPRDRYRTAAELSTALDACEHQLTAVGVERRLRTWSRVALGGLAALFVALRYLFVILLLCTYAGIVGVGVWALLNEDPIGFAALVMCLPVFLIHFAVRWEGPETSEEYANRQSGGVAGRGRSSRRSL